MRRKWLAAGLFVLILAACGSYDAPPPEATPQKDEAQRSKITGLLQQKMAAYHIPGIVLAIDLPGTGAMNIAVGVAENVTNTPMQGNELFRIGSASKSFTALAVHQLAQEGKLSLGDNVEQYLPGLLSDGQSITIGQLMDHTAGIPNFSNTDDWLFPYVLAPETVWTDSGLLGLVKDLPRTNPPGEAWHYSNSHFVLLGMIIEAVTQNTWQEEVVSRFGKGLGLPSLQVPTAFKLEGAAAGYIDWREFLGMAEDFLPVGLVEREGVHPSFIGAAGIIAANMTDSQRWIKAVVEGELLDEAGQQALFEWVAIPGTTIQMGRGIVHEPDWQLLGHRGQITGYDCSLQYRYSDLKTLVGGASMAICMTRSVSAPGASNVNEIILYDLVDLLFPSSATASGLLSASAAERSRTAGSILNSGF